MAGHLDPVDIVRVWEWGRNRHPVDRALLILAAADPRAGFEELAALTVGQRDAALLGVREATFGPRVPVVAACPACASELEFTIRSDDVRLDPGEADTAPAVAEVPGYRLTLRSLDSRDLAAVACCRDVTRGRRLLFERAVVSAERDGEPVPATDLPDSVLDAVAERTAQQDPQADITFALSCPACDHRWETDFDITTFLWADIAAYARRLLREVHTLARAYGWSEHEILSLSPPRRQVYLELVGSP